MSDIVENVCGWVGSAIAMFFYISPIVPVIKLIKKEIDIGKIPGVLLLCSLLNCLLWCEYGVQLEKLPVSLCNAAGGVTTAIWLIFYWIYFAECKWIPALVYNILMINIIAEIFYICYAFAGEEYNAYVGYIAMVFNVLMYAAPGEKLVQVCKTGDYELIPIVSSIAGVFCSSFWGVYGIVINDWNIIIPNALGVCCAIMQVVFWIIYYQKRKGQPATTEDEGIDKFNEPIVRNSSSE